MKKVLFPVLALVLAVGLALPIAVAPAASAQTDEDRTPFQQSIIEAIAQRKAQGLPVPSSVSFEYSYDSDTKTGDLREREIMPGEQFTITAKTVIHFDNPEQAGVDKWPALIVEGDIPPDAEGFVSSGDYSQAMRDGLEQEIPGIWDQYEFGYEPRTYVFEETKRINFSEQDFEELALLLSESTNVQEILMGFTFSGPDIDYTIKSSVEVGPVTIYEFEAGFKCDWGLGLRLPMEVSLTSPDSISEGSTYTPTSSVKGLDWSAEDFEQADVEPEDGNEFVLRFELFCGVKLWVIVVGDLVDWNVEIDEDGSKSFETPFGPGSSFPIDPLKITLKEWDFGVAGAEIGLYAQPNLGSSKFTADWQADGDASGSGDITYTNPSVSVPLGSVSFNDYDPGTDDAYLSLSEFRYYFNQFTITLGAYIELWIDVLLWAGELEWLIDIYTFDLSWLTDGLSLGVHEGTTDTVTKHTDVKNVPPTAIIDKSVATLVNGNPTFLAHVGDSLDFYGDATDPGLDPLVLSWDWDDGPPSPDVITPYPLPRDATVTEMQTHAFDYARLYDVSFMADDDDGGHGEDHVAVIITANADKARMKGYWQHQYSGKGKIDFDEATLEGYLTIVSHMSTVFNEARDTSTIEKAHDVFFQKQNKGSAIEQLDRELLVVWLNFANGAIDYMELVDSDLDGIVDTPFADVVAAAEVVRLDPDATKEETKRQTQILHHVSEMAE